MHKHIQEWLGALMANSMIKLITLVGETRKIIIAMSQPSLMVLIQ